MDIKDKDHDASLAVEVDSLVKRYGELVAVDGLSLTIPRGQVLGLLGPTCSGKTTTPIITSSRRSPTPRSRRPRPPRSGERPTGTSPSRAASPCCT